MDRDYPKKKTKDLTPEENRRIRADLSAGKDPRAIAKEIGCSRSQVAGIKANMAMGR
jgi:CENP-B N-terminal DNA-binding domain